MAFLLHALRGVFFFLANCAHLSALIGWLGLDANQIFVPVEPAKTEKTYTNFSDLLALTRSATIGPDARENNPRSPKGSSATCEKIGPRSGP